MGHHIQLSMHMFVNCKVNLIYSRHIAISFCFYLIGHCPKTTSGSNISTQNDSAGISYQLGYKQQTRVQTLTFLSSKDIWALFTVEIFQK